MQKVISKLKEGVLVLGLSITFSILLAGMIASVGIVMIAIKLAWFGVTL